MPNVKTQPSTAFGVVPNSRRITTSTPLTGGGTLASDLTLGIDTSAFGDVFANRRNTFAAFNQHAGALFIGGVQCSGGKPSFFGEVVVYGQVSSQWTTTSGWIGDYNQVHAIRGTVHHGGSSESAISEAIAIRGQVINSGGGTITNAYGGWFGVQYYPSGVTTNAYGVYIDTVSGSTAYGLYQVGQQPNVLRGSLYQGTVAQGTRYLTSGEIGSLGGTVTNIKIGSNLVLQPASAITTTGTIALDNSIMLPGNVQVSGGNLAVYTPWGFNNQHYLRSIPDADGVQWALVGSGTITGRLSVQQYFAGDGVTFTNYPVYVDGSQLTVGAGRFKVLSDSTTRIEGDIQTSGTFLAHTPIFQQSVAGANRYVISGELGAGTGTMTSIVAGRGIAVAPSPITTTGSIGLADTINFFSGQLIQWQQQAGGTGYLAVDPSAGGVGAGGTYALYGSGILQGRLQLKANLARDAVTSTMPIYQATSAGANRYVTSGELSAGSVTQISIGTNLVMQPSPITTTGSIALADTVVLNPGQAIQINSMAGQTGALQSSPNAAGYTYGFFGSGIVRGRTQFESNFATDTVTFGLQVNHSAPLVAPSLQCSGGIFTGYAFLLDVPATYGYFGVSRSPYWHITSASNTAAPPRFIGRRARGTLPMPSGVGINDHLVGFAGWGWSEAGNWLQGANMSVYATEHWNSGGTTGSEIRFHTIPSGTTTLTEAFRLRDTRTAVFAGPAYSADHTVGANRYLPSGELSSAGTVISLAAGSNVLLQPATITTTGSIGLANSLSIPGDVQISGITRLYRELTVSGNIFQGGRRWANVEAELGYRTSDVRLTNYPLTVAYDMPFRSSLTQSGTLATGENLIHGFIYAKGYLIGTTRTSPAKLLRFDPDNLSHYDVLTFPNDGLHNIADDVVYVPQTDRAYIAHGTAPSGIRITEINLDTLSYTDVANYDFATTSTSVASDGTYLYVVPGGTSPDGYILRYSLANWTNTTLTMTNVALPHAIRFDGSALFVTTNDSPAQVARVTTSPFALAQRQPFFTGDNIATDDFAETGNHLYVGCETNNGHIFRIAKNTLTIEKISTGVYANIYSLFFDGRYVWAAYATAPGTLVRLDPVSLEVRRLTLSGLNVPNELASDGQRLFGTCWQSPAQVFRVTLPPMESSVSYVTPSGGVHLAITTDGSIVLGGGYPKAGVQLSGTTTVLYGPIHQGSITSAQRYVTSGELTNAIGSPSGDFIVSGQLHIYNTRFTDACSTTAHVVGWASSQGLGPLYVRSYANSGTMGVALTLDNTGVTNGQRWSLLNTGPNASPGVGALGAWNDTSALYGWLTYPTSFVHKTAVQVSGVLIGYEPIYQNRIAAANRYIISGELPWSGVVARYNTFTSWANSKAEQSIINYTVPANTLSTNRGYRVCAAGALLGVATAGITPILRYGGAMVTSGQVSTTAGGTPPGLSWSFQAELIGLNATNAQSASAWLTVGGAATASGVFAAQTAAGIATNPQIAVNSTQAQALTLNLALGAASVNASGIVYYAIVENL